jgi:proline iminopeptidase
VSDIEALRKHLGISKWHMVFGGSWGSTLALAYAQAHPSSVGSLVLRGIFVVRDLEFKWTLIPGGASILFPDHFEEFINFLPEEERADHVASYHKRLMSDDESISHPAARAWNKWEVSISTLYPNIKGLSQLDDASYNLAHARTEIHYFRNKAWLEEGQLLKKENVDKIRHIPSTIHEIPTIDAVSIVLTRAVATIVQGRYDIVCPPITAWELHKAFPESKLHWISDAGHSATVSQSNPGSIRRTSTNTQKEPGTKKKLMEACDEYANI